ncbi:hypothetical protein PHLGIDRAFT_19290 [Phlebiopsis gigantea 11061_1 CR5-6]|uniref:Uncharacterized protein n=1 Tax=Phlebiopsis gigantea (strain 11061_1 CR5-6) TaxID=745531 RepID=A0A0C3PKW8_PHLG1|nr:hypothetical protein PHLGIDRAFT_19290 [Phlebiopsis gigantea 11061_1 CR5-6]
MTALEAVGPNWREKGKATQYFTLDGDTGTPGNITVRQDRSPSLFYIHNDQLWHYHNASMILPVNVLNSTASAQLPLQVVVGNKRGGVKGGSWRWQGTRLFYEQGSADNSGVYYSCQDTNGLMGLFFFLKGAPTPPGCTLFTVHSFMRQD